MSGGFSPLPHAGHENLEADTHVESFDDALSDAGSTPAASTTLWANKIRLFQRLKKPLYLFCPFQYTDVVLTIYRRHQRPCRFTSRRF